MMLDMQGMTWNHAKNMTPFAAKRMLSILQVMLGCNFIIYVIS